MNRFSERVLEAARSDPDRIALVVDDESWSYGELVAAALDVAQKLPDVPPDAPQGVVGIMIDRCASAYIGLFAARLAGYAYVPLNVNHPCSRNLKILRSFGAESLVCGAGGAEVLQSILELGPEPEQKLQIINIADRKSGFSIDQAVPEQDPIRRRTVLDED